MSEDSGTGGVIGITERTGNVLQVAVNEAELVPDTASTPGDNVPGEPPPALPAPSAAAPPRFARMAHAFEAASSADWQLSVPPGVRVVVHVDEGDGWSEVSLADGSRGHVPAGYLSFEETARAATTRRRRNPRPNPRSTRAPTTRRRRNPRPNPRSARAPTTRATPVRNRAGRTHGRPSGQRPDDRRRRSRGRRGRAARRR